MQAVQLPVRVENVASACKYLVSVSLMPHVPHNAVVRSRKDVMEGYGKLRYTESRCKMPRVYRELLHDILAQFLANLRQLVHRKFPKIFR